MYVRHIEEKWNAQLLNDTKNSSEINNVDESKQMDTGAIDVSPSELEIVSNSLDLQTLPSERLASYLSSAGAARAKLRCLAHNTTELLKRLAEEEKIEKYGLDIPDELCCPITCDLFIEPVKASDGFTYEKSAIQDWLTVHNTSPMTNLKLPSKALAPDIIIVAKVVAWQKKKDSSNSASDGSLSTGVALLTTIFPKLFVLRVIAHESDDGGILRLINNDPPPTWLPHIDIPRWSSVTERLLFDPFRYFSDQYLDIAGKIALAVSIQDKKIDEEVLQLVSSAPKNAKLKTKKSINNVWGTLLASMFVQGNLRHAEEESTSINSLQEFSVTLEKHATNVIPASYLDLFVNGLRNMPFCKEDQRSNFALFHLTPGASTKQLLKLQFIFHVATLAIDLPESFLHNLLFSPATACELYLPSIPEDMLKAVMRAVGNVTKWWTCPCGERYAVGNCGRLNQAGRCSNCGGIIGGQNKHGSTVPQGHKAYSDTDMQKLKSIDSSQIGYGPVSGTAGTGGEDTGRDKLSRLCVRVMRAMMHALLSLSCAAIRDSNVGGSNGVAILLANKKRKKTKSVVKNKEEKIDPTQLMSAAEKSEASHVMAVRFEEDWASLKEALNLDDQEVAVALHLTLSRFRIHSNSKHKLGRTLSTGTFKKVTKRNEYENAFQQHCIDAVLVAQGIPLSDRIMTEITKQKVLSETETLKPSMDGIWAEIHETDPKPAIASQIWQYHRPVSFSHFARWIELRAPATENEKTQCQFLKVFLDHEKELPFIKYLPGILEWHQTLFESISDGSLSREEALELTNRDAIKRLPEERRGHALHVFSNFAKGFNTVFPTMEQIECHPNSYRDLFMDLDVAVAISLPCAARTGEGLEPGMCTVALLNHLARLHNQILLEFNEAGERKRREIAIIVEGTKIEARWRGKEVWYPGTVVRSHIGDTYDIHYDDDDMERHVSRSLIRVLEKQLQPNRLQKSVTLRSWRCEVCTFNNAAGTSECQVCSARPPSTVKMGSARHQFRRAEFGDAEWQCRICMLVNGETSMLCSICGNKNPALGEIWGQKIPFNDSDDIGAIRANVISEKDSQRINLSKNLPSVNYLSPPLLVRRQLLDYNRKEALMPILRVFSQQSTEYGSGQKLAYALGRISSELSQTLLSGKAPILLEVREYRFRGEIHKAGHIASLSRQIRQQELPKALKTQICEELDTKNAAVSFITLLEECISFLASWGSSGTDRVDGSLKLQEYALNTLLVEHSNWEKVSVPTISRHVRLCHLKSLWTVIENSMRGGGDVLANLSDAYRKPLSNEAEISINTALGKLSTKHLQIISTCLREFIMMLISGQMTCSPHHPLGPSLGWIEVPTELGGDGEYLNEFEWFENSFPDELLVENIFVSLQMFEANIK